MRRWSAIFAAFLLCLTLSACKEGRAITKEEESLVGTWQSSDIKFIFQDNGIGQIVVSIMSVDDAGSDFTYSAKNGVLTLTHEDGTVAESDYTIKGDQLTVSNETGTGVYTRIE